MVTTNFRSMTHFRAHGRQSAKLVVFKFNVRLSEMLSANIFLYFHFLILLELDAVYRTKTVQSLQYRHTKWVLHADKIHDTSLQGHFLARY